MSRVRIFLAGGATMAIALATITVLTGAVDGKRTAAFDELTVRRINIVESDGTKRMIIASRSAFPGDFVQGKETKRPDRNDVAGMIFINDEGTENGGLIYGGKIGPTGNAKAMMSLTFDRFRQDQTLQLMHDDSDGRPTTAVKINDAPDFKSSSLSDVRTYALAAENMSVAQRAQYFEQLRSQGKLIQPRIFLGTTPDRASSLVLKDSKGRPRMVLSVSAGGDPEIKMLNERGEVTKTVNGASN